MDANHDILTTKLYAPPPRRNLVERSRLLSQLNNGIQDGHRLFLVSAPAGYGKTTLLVEWLHQLPESFTWLSLDASDNDLQRFVTYLIAALQQIDATLGETTTSLLASPELPLPSTLMTALINEIAAISTPFSLVLDDYHLIISPEIHEVVIFLLEHQPPQLRLVLTTRYDPPLSLARLRVRHLLTEIRASDLRFTTDEATTFFQQTMGVELTAEAVQALDERTEGWVAGLQLAALSVQGWDEARVTEFVAAFSGSHYYVIDYLAEEVLNRQTNEVRDFLHQTAILDRFCAELCDAVLGSTGSQAILSWLERADLFLIPLDHEHQWYRYHHLFADTLRTELNAEPQQRMLLQQRAAIWLEAHGFVREAIDYALAAEDWEAAGRLIQSVADEALNHFELGVLNGWLNALPDPVVLADPELMLLKACIITLVSGNRDDSLALVARFDDESRDQLSPRSQGRLASLEAEHALFREEPNAAQMLREALAQVDQDDPLFRQRTLVLLGLAQRLAGNTRAAAKNYIEAIHIGHGRREPFFTMYALHDRAFNLIIRGQRREAQELCEAAFSELTSVRGQSFPTCDRLLVPLAACAYEANDLVQARDLAQRGREEYRRLNLKHSVGLDAEQILI